jgi:hypothetical protein
MIEPKHNREDFYKIELRTPFEIKDGKVISCEKRWACFPEPYDRHYTDRLPLLYARTEKNTKENIEELIDIVLSIPVEDRPNPLEGNKHSEEHYAAERRASQQWTEIFKSKGAI